MTSVQTLRRELDDIAAQANVREHAVAWKGKNGGYSCDGYTFKTRKQLEKYGREQGYTIHIISWIRVTRESLAREKEGK